MFGLTEDGELWSKTSFNYEKANTHSIRVVAVDSYGLSVEKSFVVKVKDVTVPMVETEIPVLLDNGRVLVGGKMISNGPVEQTGVYISERPIVRTDDENVRKVVVDPRMIFSLNDSTTRSGKGWVICHGICQK